MSKKIGAILLAAGSGQRFHGAKQFINFLGKPLWQHAYDTACAVVEPSLIVRVGIDVPGGASRCGSVKCGLAALPADVDRVLIIEAARPLVTEEQLRQLADDEHPSTSFVMPLVNTVVMRTGEYLDRGAMYDLLTPQAFDCRLLRQALADDRFLASTDETRPMFEFHGIKPYFIPTGENLVKVTYQRDVPVVEAIYKQMHNEGGEQ